MYGQLPWGQGGSIGTPCETNKECSDPYVCCGNLPGFRVCIDPPKCMEAYEPRKKPLPTVVKVGLVAGLCVGGYYLYRAVS